MIAVKGFFRGKVGGGSWNWNEQRCAYIDVSVRSFYISKVSVKYFVLLTPIENAYRG